MYKKILVAVDISEADVTQPALEAAVALAKVEPDAALRLVNVQPLVPVAFIDYIPPNFDEEMREATEKDLAVLRGKIALPAARVSSIVRFGAVFVAEREEDGGAAAGVVLGQIEAGGDVEVGGFGLDPTPEVVGFRVVLVRGPSRRELQRRLVRVRQGDGSEAELLARRFFAADEARDGGVAIEPGDHEDMAVGVVDEALGFDQASGGSKADGGNDGGEHGR